MTQFAGLRSKMYACKVDGVDAVKKAKGVKSYVVKNQITFDDYIDCLENGSEKVHSQNQIRSHLHSLYSQTQKKISLSPHDDKRYLMADSYNTLPWGHYSIMS